MKVSLQKLFCFFDFGNQDLNLYWRDEDEDLLAEAGFEFIFLF